MAQIIKNVILIGASGTIGTPIFKALVDSGKFNISVLSRPESRKATSYPANIKVFKSDYDEASLLEAFKNQDAVISVLGAAGISEESKIVDAAAKAGVKRFLPSAFGINSQSIKAAELLPPFKIKLQTNAKLKALEANMRMTWTSIETGLAFDWGAQFGLIGFNVNTKEAIIYDDGNKPFSTTNLSQIGNAVVSVLLHPEETANQYIYINSFTATQNQILAEFEKASGEKWKITQASLEATKKEGLAVFAKGDFSGAMLLLKVMTFGEGFGADFVRDYGLANEKLGLPNQDLASTVAALVAGSSI